MPDPQVVGPPDPNDPGQVASIGEFADALRRKYPELKGTVDDQALARATLKLYPEFKPFVQDPDAPRPAPANLQPPPVTFGAAGGESHIGPNPGGRPITPLPGEYGFEAGWERVKQGARNFGRTLLGQPPPGSTGTFDALSRATTDVVVGGVEAASPLMLPAAALAPLPTAAAVGTGIAGQRLTQAFLDRYSKAPAHVKELLANVVGLAAGGQTGHALAEPPSPVTQPRSIPAEARFQTRVQQAATANLEGMGDRQNLAEVEATLARNRQAAAEADAQLKATASTRIISRMSLDAARAIHTRGTRGASPFAYLDTLQDQTTKLIAAGHPVPPPLPPEFGQAAESFARVPPVEAGEPPPQLPAQAGPSTTTPQNFIIGAEPGMQGETVAPPRVDEFGRVLPPAVGEPRVSAPTPEAQFESQQLGDLIDRAQSAEERQALQQQQDAYTAAHHDAAYDNASELEQWTYDPTGRTIDATYGSMGDQVTRPLAGSPLYGRITRPVVGNAENGPGRALIAQLARAYAETGAKSAADLPTDYLPADVQRRLAAGRNVPEDEQAFYTSRKFKNQYDRYIDHIRAAADARARERLAPPPGSSPGEGVSAEDLFSIGRGPEREPQVTGEAGPPPAVFSTPIAPGDVVAGQPPPQATIEGEMPPDWLGLPAEAAPTATFLGYQDDGQGGAMALYNVEGGPRNKSTLSAASLEREGIAVPETPTLEEYQADPGKYRPQRPEQQPSLPGAEGVRQQEIPTPPVAEAPFALEAPAQGEAPVPAQESLFKRMLKEEGHLILDVAPGDLTGLKRWYKKQEGTYGDEDWYQAGVSALAAGDPDAAWRVASIASARNYAAVIGGAAQRNREAEPIPGVTPDQIKASLAADGVKLPKGASIGEGGVVKFPGNPGGLDPKYSDLTLGKYLVKDLVDMVDPATIVRIEDEEGKLPADLPPELRISKQMADQILQQMPDEVLEPFMETTGLDRGEVAGHLARAASQAGKTLAVFKHWQDAHWDEILHLNAEMGGTRGPGAAGRVEFLPEERQALILDYLQKLKAKGKATPEMLDTMKEMGFALPKTIKPETKDALTYTRRWLTKQRRLAELGHTLDLAAESGQEFDRVAAASALGLTNERSSAGQIFDDVFGRARLSFMLSQASTAMKILESHGLRYNLGSLEEVLSGVAARAMGKEAKAQEHFATARNMSTLKPGTFPTGLLTKPWTDSLGDMFNYTMESVTGLAEDDRRRALATLDAFPRDEARMTGAALLGEEPSPASKIPVVKWLVDPRTRNVLTVGIRMQAAAIRSGLYDATLRALIQAKGDNPADILGQANPGQALIAKYGEQEAQVMVGSGVAAALNYTYAGRPLPDSLPGKLVDTMTSLPVVSTLLRMEWAFPRFQFSTVPRWIWDRTPGTLIFDALLKKTAGIGRLAKGAEKEALEATLIPTQLAELNKARYQSAASLQESMASRLDSREAAKALQGLEKKIGKQGLLPEFLDQMHGISETMQGAVQKAQDSARAHRAAEARVSDLLAQVKQAKGRLGQLQEVDAPTFEQALARQAVGVGVLMPLALAMRNSKGAEDTDYYQYKLGGKLLDTRPFLAGFGPFLLYADFFSDVAKHTDWSEVQKAHEGGADWNDAFKAGYNGRYTDHKLLADTMEAWLTVHPLFGTVSYITDALAGRQAEGEQSFLGDLLDNFLATTGQAIGSFFLPAQTLSDLAGAVVPSEAVSRTPERPGQYTSPSESLTEPAVSHLPGVRETITAPVSPFTGEEKRLEHPGLHQLLGTTFGPEATEAEQEVLRTGLKPGLALPRISGDREFDNKVAQAYAQILKENLPDLLADAEYQRLPMAHRRDVLEQVFKQLKAGAYGTVAEQVGDEITQAHVRPDQTVKLKRWQALAEQWAAEAAPAAPAPAESAPPAFGVPPPAAP